MSASDTIFAVSSGSGTAAISIIRISGTETQKIVLALTGRCPSPRTYTTTRIVDPKSEDILDQSVVVWLPSPYTYTGEDMAELFVHGGRATVSSVLSALADMPDCRMAEPGEFTKRAVLNGKMDLVEAEGLGDLLAAETTQQQRQALNVMLGCSSSVFEKWRRDLILIRSNIEALLDFSDQDGVSEGISAEIDASIRFLVEEMTFEVSRSSTARAIRDGVKVVLAGRPNTGKSSLLNVLVGHDAALVSAVAGTTRDIIEIRMDMGGIPVLLTDTAGLRDTSDELEAEGIRRGQSRIEEADIVVWVMAPDVEHSETVWPRVVPDLRVMGKSDQLQGIESSSGAILVSARTHSGVADLLNALQALVSERFKTLESPVVVSARQRSLAAASIRFLNEALSVNSSRLELKADWVRKAGIEVGRITGKIDVEEWLGAIFSRFCIGK